MQFDMKEDRLRDGFYTYMDRKYGRITVVDTTYSSYEILQTMEPKLFKEELSKYSSTLLKEFLDCFDIKP